MPLSSIDVSNPRGWIRLTNGAQDAGYINLVAPGDKVFGPALELNPPNGPPYIVIEMPVSDLPMLLDILRNEGKLQIRYDDNGAPPPFAIIEPLSPVPKPAGVPPPISKRREKSHGDILQSH